MKSSFLKTMLLSVVSLALCMTVTAFVGCGPKNPPPDPDARVPNVPPSTRGGKGGAPGAAGDVNKKKKTSSIYAVPSEIMQS